MPTLKIRRNVRPNDQGLFREGCYVAHKGYRYYLDANAIASLVSDVWCSQLPEMGREDTTGLLLYRSREADSGTFIGAARRDLVKEAQERGEMD
jgi:hypothetical protein